MTEHLADGAELFAAGEAIAALPAGDEIVQADRVADAEAAHVLAYGRDLAGDFVPEGEGERFDP